MTAKTGVTSSCYKETKHWPPYTYRDYPEVAPETLQAFIDFLGTENTSNVRKELQPWIPFCTMKCSFCYFPTELTSSSVVGEYVADMVVNGVVLLELKAAEKLADVHSAQLLNYLKSTEIEVGLLLNFGPQAEFRRKIYDNSRKGTLSWTKLP